MSSPGLVPAHEVGDRIAGAEGHGPAESAAPVVEVEVRKTAAANDRHVARGRWAQPRPERDGVSPAGCRE